MSINFGVQDLVNAIDKIFNPDIELYQTADGEMFTNRRDAEKHEETTQIDQIVDEVEKQGEQLKKQSQTIVDGLKLQFDTSTPKEKNSLKSKLKDVIKPESRFVYDHPKTLNKVLRSGKQY